MKSVARRLSTRLYWIVGLCVTLTVLILISVSMSVQQRTLIAQAEAKLTQTADVFKTTLDVILLTRQEALRNLAANLSRWQDNTHPMLEDEAALKQLFDHLWVVDARGRVVDEYPKLGALDENLSIERNAMFLRAQQSDDYFLTSPQNSYYTSELIVNAVVPVRDADGSFAGAVVGAFSLHNNMVLNRIITTPIGRNGYVAIVNRQAQVIAHPEPRMVGMPLGDDFEFLQGAISDSRQQTGMTEDAQGTESIQVVRSLAGGDWFLVTSLSLAEAMQPVHQLRRVQWIVGGITIVMSLLFLTWIVRTSLRPLVRLQNEVSAIKEGRLIQLTEPGLDELRQLVFRFNGLLAQNEAAQHALQQRQAYLDQILKTSSAGLFMADVTGQIEYVNPRLTTITGFNARELQQSGFLPHLSGIHRDRFAQRVHLALEEEASLSLELEMRHSEGQLLWLSLETAPVFSEGLCIGHVGTVTDITAQQQKIEALRHAAHEDTLTGLLNRRGIEKAMHNLFIEARSNQQALMVLALDLDNFKQLNDDYGHAFGDSILKNVAAMLRRFTRDTDVLGRLGGDEFVIFLPNCPLQQGERIASELVRAIGNLKDTKGTVLPVTVSIGVAALQDDDSSVAMLLGRADIAAYEAKHAGRNQWATASD
ncbi:hypothetical protein CWE12_01670 [Aliidiomarina sedimenti]|uniref:Diguanylate cyclase n=1 Tax=Aliidiomarina sedimenti TaxID=1933879 RepID=A0ABY0C1V5_9GAMM|nr:diguanylate cyclase [Aliidiomarina sedimenti]RUO31734.1 hypothetical protein CWE12_01670 [Aliidiomarina sedimenti]